jgi:hypothetical protein
VRVPEAYQGSLRPHPVVEAALRKLDFRAAESLRFVPRAMRPSPPSTPPR